MKSRALALLACAVIAIPAFTQPPQNNFAAGPQEGPSDAPHAGQPNNSQPQAIFSAFDADGDGAITKAEIRKVIAALKKLDVDKDGKITFAEMSGNAANANLPNQQPNFAGDTGFNNGGGFAGRGGFPSAGDPRQGSDLMQYDTNGDGSLSPNEMPAHLRAMVRTGDQNGNGQLDANELRLLGQRLNERARGQRPLPPGVTVGPNGVRQP